MRGAGALRAPLGMTRIDNKPAPATAALATALQTHNSALRRNALSRARRAWAPRPAKRAPVARRPAQPPEHDRPYRVAPRGSSPGNVNGRSGPDVPGGSQTLAYTPFDLPKTVTTGDNTVTLDYSADEERVARRDLTTVTHYVPDLYERRLDGAGNTLEERFRLYAGDRQLGEIVRTSGSDRTLYFHTDHLGSTTTVSDNTGEVTTQSFDPFGAPISPPNPALTRVGFTGQEQDIDWGLTDMKGRIYDPLAGRFMSSDPMMQAPFWSQGLNRYSYVFNNPVNNTDPSGYLSLAAGYQGGAYFTDGGWGVAGSFAGLGLTIGLDIAGVGLPGGARAGETYSVAPTASAKSSALTPQTVQAKGQNQGGALEWHSDDAKLIRPDHRVACDTCGEDDQHDPYGLPHFSDHGRINVLPAEVIGQVLRSLGEVPGRVWRWLWPLSSGEIGGEVVGWGTGQTAEAVAQTNSVTQNLTREGVREMIKNGLTRERVEQQLTLYRSAATNSVKVAKNAQLVPRTALMEKILQLWPK